MILVKNSIRSLAMFRGLNSYTGGGPDAY